MQNPIARLEKLGLSLSDIAYLSGLETHSIAKMRDAEMAPAANLYAIAELCAAAGPAVRERALARSVEEWRPIPGIAGYEASDKGQIRRWRQFRSHATAAILKPNRRMDGYLRVTVWIDGKKHHRPVHRLVCLAFHGLPRPGFMACHQDGVKTHNVPGNLYWGSAAENYADQLRHGTARLRRGEKARSPLVLPAQNDDLVQIPYKTITVAQGEALGMSSGQVRLHNKNMMLRRKGKLDITRTESA